MPKNRIDELSIEHLAQQLSEIVGDKLTLPLTVLHQLRDGKHVGHRLIERAI